MKKIMKHILGLIGAALLIITILFTGLSVHTQAFGDYNDYDYGTSTDWDSGWDSDWDDYSSSSGYSSSSSNDGWGDSLFFLIYLVMKYPAVGVPLVAAIIIFSLIAKAKRDKDNRRYNEQRRIERRRGNYGNEGNARNTSTSNNRNSANRQPVSTGVAMPDRTNAIAEIVKENDPYFTAPDFISFAKDVYMDIQVAWCKRDLTEVQPVLHQNLYQRTQKQLDKKIEDGIVPHLDRITVNSAYPSFYRKDEEYEYVTVYLVSQMIDYQVKESTGEVVYGDKSTRWTMHYLMTFMRSISAVTRPASEKEKGMVCPNCGAHLKGTSFGQCEYCGTVVTTGIYEWVLSDFNVSKPGTSDEGIVK